MRPCLMARAPPGDLRPSGAFLSRGRHMGSAQATEFLAAWITRNIGPSGYDNERCARGLSIRCFEEAGAAGILGADLTEAAHGELEGYLLDQLNDAADAAHAGPGCSRRSPKPASGSTG